MQTRVHLEFAVLGKQVTGGHGFLQVGVQIGHILEALDLLANLAGKDLALEIRRHLKRLRKADPVGLANVVVHLPLYFQQCRHKTPVLPFLHLEVLGEFQNGRYFCRLQGTGLGDHRLHALVISFAVVLDQTIETIAAEGADGIPQHNQY